MEAFMGRWKSGPGDVENMEAYATAIQQPQMVKDFENGGELVFFKEGDNFVGTSSVGGVEKMRQVLHPDGKVVYDTANIPADIVKVTHRMEGGKMIMEGTVGGVETTKSVMLVEGGKMIAEISTMGVSMKTTYTKA